MAGRSAVNPRNFGLCHTGYSLYELVSFPDLLAKAYLAKPLTAFGKTFVRRSGTRFGFLLGARGVIRPIYTYFKPNYLNFHSSLSYS